MDGLSPCAVCLETGVPDLFRSGDLTEVDISRRLGGNGSVVTGSAWFDDLVLIELPELPPPVKHEAKDKSGKTGG